jgi:hypothetical protein
MISAAMTTPAVMTIATVPCPAAEAEKKLKEVWNRMAIKTLPPLLL